MSSSEFDMAAEAEQAWGGFRGRLADRLADLEDGETVSVELESALDDDELIGAAPYLQFVGWGEDLVRAEMSSNQYLDERHLLAISDEELLGEIGWLAPTYADGDEPDDGSTNFHFDLERREADLASVMAVRALREVFGCLHPAFLVVDGLPDEEHADAAVPPPGPVDEEDEEPLAAFPESAEELQGIVDRALTVMFGESLRHDDDGDVPVMCGQSVVFVRVGGARPAVELYSEVVHGISDLDRAAQEVGILNANHPIARFRVDADRIIASYRLVAWPFVPVQLRAALAQMCDDIDDLARDLAARVDGRRFADAFPAPVDRGGASETDPADDALPGLLELLYDGPVRPGQVAALFDNDRHRLIKQLVWLRKGQDQPGEHDLDLVLGELRAALRYVAEAEALPSRRRPIPPRHDRTRQLSLLPDTEDTLDAGVWARDLEESS